MPSLDIEGTCKHVVCKIVKKIFKKRLRTLKMDRVPVRLRRDTHPAWC